jgi:enamine deaminase RidA (YjgF/YER057c/UK114 family)
VSRIEARLKELSLELPEPSKPGATYVTWARGGGLVFLSGQLCHWNGERRYIGKLGREFGLEEGQAAARLCALNLMAQARVAAGGDLDRVRWVRLGGFVNSMPDFTAQPQVVNGASDLIVQVFGEDGRHARTSVGVAVLPYDVAVEVEAIIELR